MINYYNLPKHSYIIHQRVLIGLNKKCWPYSQNSFVNVVVKYIYFLNRIYYGEETSKNNTVLTIENYCYNGLIFDAEKFIKCYLTSVKDLEEEFVKNSNSIKKAFGSNPITFCTIPDIF